MDHKTDIDPKVPIETNLDGSPDIYLGPTASAGLNDGWLPTVPDKGGLIPLLLLQRYRSDVRRDGPVE